MKPYFRIVSSLAIAATLATPLMAKVIGANTGAQSLTAERIAALPDGERAAWAAYLDRSIEQAQADRATLAAEWIGLAAMPPPPSPGHGNSMPLNRDAAWYATAEARRIADNILIFQTSAGGWSKNQDRNVGRLPGQRYSNNAENMNPDKADFDAPRDRFWTFAGTLDNGATTSEMRFLGRVAAANPGASGDAYRAGILKGVRYLLAAQYPNGGWPQNWPLEGGFHDAVTFNDDAVAEAAMLLDEVGNSSGDFAFAPTDLRAAASAAAAHAIDVVLASQIMVGGQATCWPQQVDPLTLAPTSARNYEPRSIATSESVDVLQFLMRQPNPSAAVQRAVRSCMAWLDAHKIHDLAFEDTPTGRMSFPQKGSVIWSRNYDIVTGLPIFGDRDKTIRDTVNELSAERLNNYGWYNKAPARAQIEFEKWDRAVRAAQKR